MALFKYIVLSVCLCGIHLNGFAQSTREAILEDIARTGRSVLCLSRKGSYRVLLRLKGINRFISVIMHDTVQGGFNRNRIIKQWLIFS